MPASPPKSANRAAATRTSLIAHGRVRLTPREILGLLGAALFGILLIGALIAANTRWSAILPGGESFFRLWAGAREFLLLKGDPFGWPVAVHARVLAHQAALGPADTLPRLDVPFFLLPLFFPLALLPDPTVARGVWATATQLALIASMMICMRLLEWNPPRAILLCLCLAAMFVYPVIQAIVEGSPVVLLMLVYLSTLWALQQGRDELAGALLVLALFKWEVGLPFLVIVATKSLSESRWRIWAGFAMGLTVLLAASFMLYPGWFMPFLVGTVATLRAAGGISSQSALAQLAPADATGLWIGVAILVLILLLVESVGSQGSSFRRFAWTATLALAATPFLGMKSDIMALAVLVPGMVVIAAGGAHRKPYGPWLSFVLLAAMLIVPWMLMPTLSDGHAPTSSAATFLFLPSACVVGMYWTRWWFLRSPRTWLDEIRASR